MLAHSRRQRENDTFTDIAQTLPIQENAKDLDKASILRLAIHYLKLRDLLRDSSEQLEGEEGEEGVAGTENEGDVGSPEAPLLLDETDALLHSELCGGKEAVCGVSRHFRQMALISESGCTRSTTHNSLLGHRQGSSD